MDCFALLAMTKFSDAVFLYAVIAREWSDRGNSGLSVMDCFALLAMTEFSDAVLLYAVIARE